MDNLLTAKQAAEKLGISDARIRQMILKGRLPSEKFGPIHMIKETDLELIRERKPGRPPKSSQNESDAKKK